MDDNNEILTIYEASKLVNCEFKKNITTSNISYLIQYGQIRKINTSGETKVLKNDLIDYYSRQNQNEMNLKKMLGDDLDWNLSFDNIKESERTKHVHRLHPYKGKFIPQLVEYFLDTHTDQYKQEVFFQKDDIVLDPFCGSGTCLVQANELGIHAIGIDISEFNTLISNVKVKQHHVSNLLVEIRKITKALNIFVLENNWTKFENDLLVELYKFNRVHFPTPDYRFKVRNREINENQYSEEKDKEFLPIYFDLIDRYQIKIDQGPSSNKFIDKWFLSTVRQEINFVNTLIDKVQDKDIKEILSVILCRTVRSCRATTHSDLATLLEPINTTYYCTKHYKICKPLFSIYGWWDYYSRDTVKRFYEFHKLRTETYQTCLTGDSRTVDINMEIKKLIPKLSQKLQEIKIRGIFSSPPYVGMIDYHEQHAYAYELLGLSRRDELEIGPLYKGKGLEARKSYIKGISEVLNNCKKYLSKNYDIFLVANDSYNLYPEIAIQSGLKIVNEYKRPVLNRTEKDKSAYSEKIFHLKEK